MYMMWSIPNCDHLLANSRLYKNTLFRQDLTKKFFKIFSSSFYMLMTSSLWMPKHRQSFEGDLRLFFN